MKHSKWMTGPLALGVVLAGTGVALQAQPNPNEAPKADNPPNNEARPRGERRGGDRPGGRRGERPDFRELTPEQREQFEQRRVQMRERQVRGSLTNAGFTDTVIQDAVVGFVNQQETARQPLREKTRELNEAFRNEETTEAQLAALMAEYRALTEQFESNRKAALDALDAQISYTDKPRLDAFLAVSGITSEDAGSPDGMGGRGGGFGGMGFGGPGGQGFGGGFGGPGGPAVRGQGGPGARGGQGAGGERRGPGTRPEGRRGGFGGPAAGA